MSSDAVQDTDWEHTCSILKRTKTRLASLRTPPSVGVPIHRGVQLLFNTYGRSISSQSGAELLINNNGLVVRQRNTYCLHHGRPPHEAGQGSGHPQHGHHD